MEIETFYVDISVSGENLFYRQVCVLDLFPNYVFKVNCCNIICSLEMHFSMLGIFTVYGSLFLKIIDEDSLGPIIKAPVKLSYCYYNNHKFYTLK